MPCQNMHFWTVTGLVGAFLDLAIAYFLLCASTMAFFASEFLGLFGLKLPCPCDGLFTNPTTNYCLQRLLFDCPTEKISSVHLSVRNNFPFDSALEKDKNVGVKLIGDGSNYGSGYYVELEGETSCSSVSDANVSKNVGGRELVPRNRNDVEFDVGRCSDKKLDFKGKGISNHRPKVNIRRRRKGGFDHRKSSSVSSYDQLGIPRYSSSSKNELNENLGGRSAPDEVEANYFLDDGKAPRVMSTGGSGSNGVDLKKSFYEMNPKEKNETSDEDLRSDAGGALSLGDEINTIGVLEKALKEEHTARAALYIELEKERSAAASAADEAMAMILRLQEEKASIEMQARQYQRVIEEKSAYDAEEMNILKEIVLRREREKHFLEKEVEAYRQMLYSGKEQLEGDIQSMVDKQRQDLYSSLHLSEDTDLMLHELSESIRKKEVAKSRSSCVEETSKDTQQRPLAQLGSLDWDKDDVLSQQQGENEHFSPNCSYDSNQELQEKEMVSTDNSQLSRPIEGQRSSGSQEHHINETTIPNVSEEHEKNGFEYIFEGKTKNVNTHNMSRIPIQRDGQDMQKHEKDATLGSIVPGNVTNEKELHIYDVHVINRNSKICNEVSGKKTELLLKTDTSEVINANVAHEVSEFRYNGNRRDSSSASRIDTSTDFNRSSLDMAIGLPPSGSREKYLPVSQRSSISASDTERLKIDIEVEWLREKLRAVRERRTKLNISVDQDKEKLQLQLLEDIASQLREIRLMTQPEKAMRQASLPPPSSKAMSKKRRCPGAYVNNSS